MKYFKILLILFAVFTVSCTQEDINPPLCPDGDCDGLLYIPYPQDENGYYRVDLDFNGEYFPRFNIYVEADDVDPYYYYNDIGVVQAAFESDDFWTLNNGVVVDVVQNTTFYLNNSPFNNEYETTIPERKWGKRIVGPIHPEFQGDTITIRGEIYWDGGSKSNRQFFEEKFIIE